MNSRPRHPTLFEAACIAGFILCAAWLASLHLIGGLA